MGKSNLSVAVVCGGVSAEAEVSRSTSRGIADALAQHYTNVELLELNDDLFGLLLDKKPDVVFPGLHGSPGEDGTFQGFLDILEIPYVGSGVRASATAMDKSVAKALFRGAALPVAADFTTTQGQDVEGVIDEAFRRLGREIVVKPLGQGSAIGVTFADDPSSLRASINAALRFGERGLLEQRVQGREITCGVLEDGTSTVALPVVEIRTPKGSWYDYEHRYTVGLSEHVIPAELASDKLNRVQEIALAAHAALGCRDLSRCDFVVPDPGEPVLLELNTLPGMTPTSLYPDAARAAGIEFDELVRRLVERAKLRGKSRNRASG